MEYISFASFVSGWMIGIVTVAIAWIIKISFEEWLITKIEESKK